MLKEFFESLVGHAARSNKPELQTLPGGREVIVTVGGRIDRTVSVPPDRRNVKIDSLFDFVAYVLGFANPQIFVAMTKVLAVLDESVRDEFANLALRWSQRWAAVERLVQGVALPPKAAIQFIRYDLGSTGAELLLAALRKVDFERKSNGKSSIEHGRESYGKSVEMAVQQADDIPQTVTITIAPWLNIGLRDVTATCTFAVDIEFDEQRVVLRLLAGEMERMKMMLETKLVETIRAEIERQSPNNGTVQVFLGEHKV